jgi:hypothetical protein
MFKKLTSYITHASTYFGLAWLALKWFVPTLNIPPVPVEELQEGLPEISPTRRRQKTHLELRPQQISRQLRDLHPFAHNPSRSS